MTAAVTSLPRDSIEALDAAIENALTSGDETGLELMGYGEISCVVAWDGPGGRLACKRLPLFNSCERAESYARCFEEYVIRLRGGGVEVVDSALQLLSRDDGRCAVYCLQPALPADSLAPQFLADADDDCAESFFSALLERVIHCVGPHLGLDGQLSNWVFSGDELCYLDVSTPLMRDDGGAEKLDTELFIASLPWALRPFVRRIFLGQILDKYYRPRGVILDLLGNLYKERLDRHLPAFIEAANRRFERPLTVEEVRRYYRRDARMWAALQGMRRVDRAWQRRVRRKQYPFLLPGSISR